mmetsp:Transcript_73198/g.145190  ORF Transcript_73198/g.145190 Transcript_73198/m.145190 type:complete len:92 (-) Transcript_73198:158-433(-)
MPHPLFGVPIYAEDMIKAVKPARVARCCSAAARHEPRMVSHTINTDKERLTAMQTKESRSNHKRSTGITGHAGFSSSQGMMFLREPSSGDI